MKHRPTVVIGFIGTTLDATYKPDRWLAWRPTICLVQQEDWLVDRLELLLTPGGERVAKQLVADIAAVSPETQVCLHTLDYDADMWDFAGVYGALHDFATHYPFQPEVEDYHLHITTGTHVAQICLFLLTESRHLPGTLVQTSPPRAKPGRDSLLTVGNVTHIDLDLSKYDALASRFAKEHTGALEILKSGISTKNAAFNTLMERLERVAVLSKEPILLTGPTGSGKSLLARRLHLLRQQRTGLKGKFIEVNCATLRGDTSMSTLFGHVKGAYTGATTDRPGLLREADGGLLFLDEIGELGLDEQAMLLRALEDKEFHPFGSDRLIHSDFQLIAGTNRDLEQNVAEGRFREDLLARLNLWTFQLPGLRERREDITPNLDYELERFTVQTGRKVAFNKEARQAYLKFAQSPEATWRGNFRDLSASITRMATLAPLGRITEELVAEETLQLRSRWLKLSPDAATASPQRQDTDLLAETLGTAALEAVDPFDQVQLAYVLRVCRASRTASEAGRTLFAASRREKRSANDTDRLKKYLARFGLDWASLTQSNPESS